ncbi:MAG: hypothetical protein KDD32_01380 [Bacteroidetes bacterium]|nr:hypothetical protein [Bacteroidota bacterium]
MINVSIQQIFTGHAEPIYTLAKDIDTNRFYSGSGDGFVGKWSLKSGQFEKPVAKSETTVYSLYKITDQPYLFIGLQDGVLNIIHSENNTLIKSIKLFNSGIFDMAYLPKLNQLILASGDGNLGILDVASLTLLQTIHLSNKSLRCIDVSPCGDFAIIGASDHQLYFLDFREKTKISQTIPAHKNSVFTAIYKEGYSLITGGRDALLKEWNWLHETKEWTIKQSIPAHNYTVNKIVKHPNNQWIVTASRDKTIKLWHYDTLQLLKVINLDKFPDGHTHSVNTLLWLNDQILLSAGDDKKIIAWKVA